MSLAAAALVAVAAAGCGGASRTASAGAAGPSAFTWLHPGTPPRGWHAVPIANGATLPYPPGWRHVHGDAGTASAILGDGSTTSESDARVLGYLNLTPLQGAETLANWGHYRVDHNADEGDRAITTLAVGSSLRFRTGVGSCVRDRYTTKSGAQYVEIACLVKGARATSVIVGASPPSAWARVSPVLERAISGFST